MPEKLIPIDGASTHKTVQILPVNRYLQATRMKVTFYGVRGSIATPGPSTVRYGGNTSCVGVRTADGTEIVLDMGTGARVLGDALAARGELPGPIHVLVTHGHWDHVIGAPFFAPMYRADAHVILHALSERMHALLARFSLFD